MSQPTCELCSRPMPDTAYVCPGCTRKLAEHLTRIVDLAPEVEPVIARLTVAGRGVGSSGHKERPLPVDLAAAERAAAIGNTVATWARHVSESRGRPVPPPGRSEVGVTAAARFLLEPDNLEWLRHQQEAAEAFPALSSASYDLERLVGRPRDLWYAGPCRAELADGTMCEAEIYAIPGRSTVRCRECGAEWDAQARREWLMDAARDQLLHAEWMARALTVLGVEDVTGSKIRNLAARGRLEQKGTDAADRPLYAVGDVLDVIDEQARVEEDRRRRREAKAAKKAAREAA